MPRIGAGLVDDDAIHDNVAAEISAITEKGTPVNADLLLLEDSADSNSKKKMQLSAVPGVGTDNEAIHDNVAAEISGITEKVTPVNADLLLLEDSADSNSKKKMQLSAVPGVGTDNEAIHDNVAAEIDAITEKTTPVDADLLIVEDSAASNAKKKVQIGNLPAAAGGALTPLNTNVTKTGTDADTVEKTLASYSLPANTLDADGKRVRFVAFGITGANTNSKTMRLYVGSSIVLTGVTAVNAAGWWMECTIIREASDVQEIHAFEVFHGAFTGSVNSSLTETDSGAINLSMSGQNGSAVADDVQINGFYVESIEEP